MDEQQNPQTDDQQMNPAPDAGTNMPAEGSEQPADMPQTPEGEKPEGEQAM